MSDSVESLPETEQWKRKYYASLDAIERKEQQWVHVEDLLRKALSRLSLAADGLDPALDRQLADLRNAIRDGVDHQRLQGPIDAMASTLLRLDKLRKSASEKPDPAAPLRDLLDHLELPKGTRRKIKALRKRLDQVGADQTKLSESIKEFSALIAYANTLHVGESGGANTTPGGLLRRWLRRNAPSHGGATGEGGDLRDDLAAARSLFTYLIQRMEEGPAAPAELILLRASLLHAKTEREFRQIIDELAAHIGVATVSGDKAAQDQMLAQLFVQLLDWMPLPEPLQQRARALRERLHDTGNMHEWMQVIQEVLALISGMREHMNRERREMEEFLAQLGGRLHEVDNYLLGDAQSRQENMIESRDRDSAMEAEMRGIADDVRNASTLEQLKHTVEVHMDAIASRLREQTAAREELHRESDSRLSVLNQRLQKMEREAETLRGRIQTERAQALLDPLTGISNRLAYDERMEIEFARWQRSRQPLALLVWDVDNFKKINDAFGHRAGDKVLRTIAERFGSRLRGADFLARYGGEEFVMLMTGAEIADVQRVAEEYRQIVADAGFHFHGDAVTVTISAGITLFRDGDTPDTVFERADRALYRAKESGRNRCHCAD